MELSPKQQINELLQNCKDILVLVPENADGDSLGAALALSDIFTRRGKNVSLSSSKAPNPKYYFVDNIDAVSTYFDAARDFVIQVALKGRRVADIVHDESDEKVEIRITPSQGVFSEKDVSMEMGKFTYDLIFVLGSPDLDSLGSIYEQNSEMFYEVPIINIDNSTSNDHFGKVNFIDITATSVCEMLVSLIESWGVEYFDEKIASYLLLGIVDATASFQDRKTTPKSLTVAAQLLSYGAKKQEIISNLYKTRPFNQLKLWGRILARVKTDDEIKAVWTLITRTDFEKTKTSKDDIKNIFPDLLRETPDKEVACVLFEQEDGVYVYICTKENVHADEIVKPLGGTGSANFGEIVFRDKDLLSAEADVIESLKKSYGK